MSKLYQVNFQPVKDGPMHIYKAEYTTKEKAENRLTILAEIHGELHGGFVEPVVDKTLTYNHKGFICRKT